MKAYGFIGLGSQGAPMAQRMIKAGLPVVLWARRKESLSPFEGGNVTFAQSIESLASQVDCCCLCVVDDAGVQQVCDQLIPAMNPGSLIVVHSTVTPQLCIKLAKQAKQNGLALIDAPVSGGGLGAEQGTLCVMAGGEPVDVDRARPMFNTFAKSVFHLGKVGAGQQAKLVNNNLMAANMSLAYHAMAIAQSLDIERDAFTQLVRESSGRSFAFDVCARMKQPSDFKHGAELLNKDVNLLGEVINGNQHYLAIRQVSDQFLSLALTETP